MSCKPSSCELAYVRRCPALRKIFEAHELLCVAPALIAPLTKIVRELGDWMKAGNGEGVVLGMNRGQPLGNTQVKWKTASENQGATPDILRRMGQHLKALGLHRPNLDIEIKKPKSILNNTEKSGDTNAKIMSQQKNKGGGSIDIIDSEVLLALDTMYLVSISDCNGQSAIAVANLKRMYVQIIYNKTQNRAVHTSLTKHLFVVPGRRRKRQVSRKKKCSLMKTSLMLLMKAHSRNMTHWNLGLRAVRHCT